MRKKIVYVQVDPNDPATKRRLTVLQKSCLPYDKLYFPDNGVWWMALHKSMPIGFGCVSPSQQLSDGVYLGRCGVVNSFRGLGIQRQMIRLRVQWAKRHGYKWAVTDTTDNIPSANNLISCGFRLYTPAVLYSFARALYWKKKL
jgi:GNAT superfamily N-acetyltransferase